MIKRVATRVVKLKMKCKIILKQQYMNEIVNLSGTGEKQWDCELLPYNSSPKNKTKKTKTIKNKKQKKSIIVMIS